MIKNVIFDFGQVLVRFDPEYMCSLRTTDPDDVALLSEVVFDRLYWDKLDAGTIENKEVLECVKARLPERLHRTAETVFLNWIDTLPEIPGMRDVIALCRERGFGVYLLSNIARDFAARANEIPILSLVDDCVFSSICGHVKPSAEIFAHATEKFNLEPSTTLFVDDNENNIRGANDFGLATYHFDGDSKKLYDYIKSL